LHGGQEGAEAVDDAEEVSVYGFVEVGGVRPGAARPDARVEREEVDFPLGLLGFVEGERAVGRN